MLLRLASHSDRIASAGSPAPRKTALIRNSSMTVTLPPSMIAVNRRPCVAISGVAPSIWSSSSAKMTPMMPSTIETATPVAIA
jgi:hypothetical protein